MHSLPDEEMLDAEAEQLEQMGLWSAGVAETIALLERSPGAARGWDDRTRTGALAGIFMAIVLVWVPPAHRLARSSHARFVVRVDRDQESSPLRIGDL